MKQVTLPLNLAHRRTRKREFLESMERAVPWPALLALIAPLAPRKRTGRPPFELEAMLRIHFLQQWFSLSDLAMEEALFDVPLYREFAGLGGMSRLPDRVSILRFRHLLEEHRLAEQFLQVVNAHLAKAGLILKEGTIKRQFGHVKVRYRGLMKNTQQLFTLFALSNLWMVRNCLLNRAG